MTTESESVVSSDVSRRGLLKSVLAGVTGGLVAVVPLIPGIGFFLDPLLRRDKSGESGGDARKDADGYIRMAISFSALPEDGTPQQFTVFDDKVDAWNRFIDVPVGSVWLRRIGANLVAFNTVCPHLGCAVGHRPAENDFYCPCHTSAFDLAGKQLNKVPPRGMDTLSVRRKSDGVEQPDGDEIWIRFQNFRAASSEKIPV